MPPTPPPPRRPVPVSSIVLVVSLMVLVFSFGVDLSLGAPWLWWLIPLAAFATAGAIVAQRIATR